MKCANCSDAAWYEYKLTSEKSLFFCDKHLPKFLERAKLANLLEKTDELKDMIDEGLQSIAVSEDSTADTTPKPKTTKKAAVKNADNS